MQANQQVPIYYSSDIDYHNPTVYNQNGNPQSGFTNFVNFSTFAVAFEDAKEVARRVKHVDKNNELWQNADFILRRMYQADISTDDVIESVEVDQSKIYLYKRTA